MKLFNKKLDLKTILIIGVSLSLLFILLFITNFVPKTILFFKKHPKIGWFIILTAIISIVLVILSKYKTLFNQEDESLRVFEYVNDVVKKKFGISLSFLGTKVIGLMDKELIDALFDGRRAYSVNALIKEYNTRFLVLVLTNPFQILRWDFSELISEDEDAFHYYLDLTTPTKPYPSPSLRKPYKKKGKGKLGSYESELLDFSYENEEGVPL